MTTQTAAETANTVVVWTAERPSWRDSGGRMLNSTVWPAPMQSRLTNRMPKARRRSARVVTCTAAWLPRLAVRGRQVFGMSRPCRPSAETIPNARRARRTVRTALWARVDPTKREGDYHAGPHTGRVILLVLKADVERSLHFYRDLLGVPLRRDLDHGGTDRWISGDHAALSWHDRCSPFRALQEQRRRHPRCADRFSGRRSRRDACEACVGGRLRRRRAATSKPATNPGAAPRAIATRTATRCR